MDVITYNPKIGFDRCPVSLALRMRIVEPEIRFEKASDTSHSDNDGAFWE